MKKWLIIAGLAFYCLWLPVITLNLKHNRDSEFSEVIRTATNEYIWPLVQWAILLAVCLWAFFAIKTKLSDEPSTGNPVTNFLRPRWRKWTIYKTRWRSAFILCGVYKMAGWQGQQQVTPKFARIKSNGYIDRVQVRPIMGMSLATFERQSEELAMAFGAERCTVKRGKRVGQVWLEFERKDALAKELPAIPIPRTVDLHNVQVGIGEDGSPWTIDVVRTHMLFAGISGSGKSSLIQAILRGLGPAIRDGIVEVRIIDPKGGVEFRDVKPLAKRYEDGDYESMVSLIEETAKDMKLASRGVTGRKLDVFTPEHPLVLMIVDEMADLTVYQPDDKLRDRFNRAMGTLLTQGRANGYRVIAALQDPRMDVVKYRNLFPTRIALELDTPEQVRMVLGEGMRAKGALADKIGQPGVCYVVAVGKKEPERKLVGYVTNEDIAELVANYCPPKIEWQELDEDGIVKVEDVSFDDSGMDFDSDTTRKRKRIRFRRHSDTEREGYQESGSGRT